MTYKISSSVYVFFPAIAFRRIRWLLISALTSLCCLIVKNVWVYERKHVCICEQACGWYLLDIQLLLLGPAVRGTLVLACDNIIQCLFVCVFVLLSSTVHHQRSSLLPLVALVFKSNYNKKQARHACKLSYFLFSPTPLYANLCPFNVRVAFGAMFGQCMLAPTAGPGST